MCVVPIEDVFLDPHQWPGLVGRELSFQVGEGGGGAPSGELCDREGHEKAFGILPLLFFTPLLTLLPSSSSLYISIGDDNWSKQLKLKNRFAPKIIKNYYNY